MGIWQERFGHWLGWYLVLTFLVLRWDVNHVSALVTVALVSVLAQKGHLQLGARLGTLPASVAAASLQLLALAVTAVGLWVIGADVVWRWPAVALGPLLIAVIFTGLAERPLQEPRPRHGTEALLLTVFSIGYLVAVHTHALHGWAAVAVAHLALLTLTVMRNWRLIFHRIQEPTQRDGDVIWADEVGFREEKGWAAVTAVAKLPSSVIGCAFLALDLVVFVIQPLLLAE